MQEQPTPEKSPETADSNGNVDSASNPKSEKKGVEKKEELEKKVAEHSSVANKEGVSETVTDQARVQALGTFGDEKTGCSNFSKYCRPNSNNLPIKTAVLKELDEKGIQYKN